MKEGAYGVFKLLDISYKKKMKYNLISMDFDGTLLTSNKKVTEKNKNILLKYKNSGHIIVGVTARNLSSVKSVCDINMFNYLILNNGSYIYHVDSKSGTNICNINNDIIIDITNYFKDIAKEIDYCSINKYYIYKKEAVEKKDYITQINNISEIKEKISRMNIFLKNSDEIDENKKYIENNFPKVSAITMLDTDNNSGNKWIAINSKETNKFKALEKLCSSLNINLNQVIYFGDSTNDLPIINKVGLGIAMGNAIQEVKEQAKDITLYNDEDGIASFLEKIKN